MFEWKRSLGYFLFFLVGCPSFAKADVAAPPVFAWTYPKYDQSDVPIDTKLYFYAYKDRIRGGEVIFELLDRETNKEVPGTVKQEEIGKNRALFVFTPNQALVKNRSYRISSTLDYQNIHFTTGNNISNTEPPKSILQLKSVWERGVLTSTILFREEESYGSDKLINVYVGKEEIHGQQPAKIEGKVATVEEKIHLEKSLVSSFPGTSPVSFSQSNVDSSQPCLYIEVLSVNGKSLQTSRVCASPETKQGLGCQTIHSEKIPTSFLFTCLLFSFLLIRREISFQ